MKTTLNIDDTLLLRAKATAAREGMTLTALIEEALRARLTPRPRRAPPRVTLPTVKGTALPAIDIASREALFELLDEP
jgi:hypothetical protein